MHALEVTNGPNAKTQFPSSISGYLGHQAAAIRDPRATQAILLPKDLLHRK
jgi:hypothetical protein